jgi:hypothetical protein
MNNCTKYFSKGVLYHLSDDDKFIGNFCDKCLANYLETRDNPDKEFIQYFRNRANDFPKLSCPDEVIKC